MQPVQGKPVVRRTSARWRTFPEDIVPLGVAEMDFPIAPVVRDTLQDAIERSDLGYASPEPDLGKAFAAFAAQRWSWDVRPQWVQAVTDVGVGVVELLRVLCRPGEAVVINTPVYDPFHVWAPEVGAMLVDIPLARTAHGYRLDLAGLERAFAQRPAAYLLCNPHNPVGRVHTRDELEAVVELASRHDVTVISDEVHGPLVLPGAEFTPVLTLPGAEQIALSVLSSSKAFNTAGLKCAHIVAGSEHQAQAFERLPAESNWRVGHLGVIASKAAYEAGGPWLDELIRTLASRRAELADFLAERLPAVAWHAPEASYLAWLDFSALGNGGEIRDLFLERARVGLDPGSKHGLQWADHLRLNFATTSEVLDRATAAMEAALGRIHL